MELRLTGFDERDKAWVICKNPHKMARLKNPKYFAKENQNAQSFVEYLERTNRVCSQTFALFIPVNVTSLSDILFPWTVHYALQSDKQGPYKYVDIGTSLLIDLVTLPFRLIVLVPRGIYKFFQIPACKVHYPITETTIAGSDNELPVLVESKDRKFYFYLESIHEIQVHRYFARTEAANSARLIKVNYSETDVTKEPKLEDMPSSGPQGFRNNKSMNEVPIYQKIIFAAAGLTLTHKIDVLKYKGRHVQTIKLVGGAFGIAIGALAIMKKFYSSPEKPSSSLSTERTWGTDEDPLGVRKYEGARHYEIRGFCPANRSFTSSSFYIACYPDTPIETLKQALAIEAGKSMNQISLLRTGGKLLEDGKTLQEYTSQQDAEGFTINVLIMQ